MSPTDTPIIAPQLDPVLPAAVQLVLAALLILGAAVWIGGMAAVTVLAVTSKGVLPPALRTQLFREFGRHYLVLAGIALAVTVICGGILLAVRPWDGLATAIVLVVAALVLVLALGVRQAREIGRQRHLAVDGSEPPAPGTVTARGRRALALRFVIGLLTAAVFVLAVCTTA